MHWLSEYSKLELMDVNDTSQVPNVKEDDDIFISNEVESDHLVGQETSAVLSGDIPEVGMRFNSYNVMYNYCEDYAKKLGWEIQKRSNIQKDGIIKYVQLLCSRASRGKSHKEKNMLSSQITECFVRIRTLLQSYEKYELTTVYPKHNHLLSPKKAKRIRQHRKIDPHSRERLFVNDDASVR